MMEFFEIGLYQRAFVLLHRSPLKLDAFSLTVVTAFLGALVAAVIIGVLTVLTVLLSRLSKINDETVLAVLYIGALAIGIIVLNQLGSNQKLEDWLLGNIIALSDLDLKMSFGIVAVTVLTLFRRALVANLFDPEVAASLGIRTRLLDYVSFVILILVLITTLQAVGCVLAVGLIVAPAAIARSFVSTPNALFPLSALVGAAGAAIGLLASYHFDQPAGSSITVVLATAFLLSVLLKSLRKI